MEAPAQVRWSSGNPFTRAVVVIFSQEACEAAQLGEDAPSQLLWGYYVGGAAELGGCPCASY